jgi:hypothetical protein
MGHSDVIAKNLCDSVGIALVRSVDIKLNYRRETVSQFVLDSPHHRGWD